MVRLVPDWVVRPLARLVPQSEARSAAHPVARSAVQSVPQWVDPQVQTQGEPLRGPLEPPVVSSEQLFPVEPPVVPLEQPVVSSEQLLPVELPVVPLERLAARVEPQVVPLEEMVAPGEPDEVPLEPLATPAEQPIQVRPHLEQLPELQVQPWGVAWEQLARPVKLRGPVEPPIARAAERAAALTAESCIRLAKTPDPWWQAIPDPDLVPQREPTDRIDPK